MIDKTGASPSKKNPGKKTTPAPAPTPTTVKVEAPKVNYRQQARAAAARASAAASTGDVTTAATQLADAKTAASNIKGKRPAVKKAIGAARTELNAAKGRVTAAEAKAAADEAAATAAKDKAAADAAAMTHNNAVTLATTYLNNLGVGNLGITAADLNKLVSDYGDDVNMIGVAIESTTGWQTRFKGLMDMRASGDAMKLGIVDEAAYLKLENDYREVFKNAELTSLITDDSGNDIVKISDMINKFKNSVAEVGERIADAKRIVNDTDPAVRSALKDFYNIDANDLVKYSLDPANAATELNKKANAAMFAGLARTAGLNVNQAFAEQTMQNYYGSDNIDRTKANDALQAASSLQSEVSGLAAMEGGSLTAEESISATLGTSAAAEKKVSDLRSRERARFTGTSAIQQRTLRRGGGV